MVLKISSLQHPLVKHLVRLRKNSDYRYDHHTVLLEGKKMIHEFAIDHPIKSLFVSDEALIPTGIKCDEIVFVTEAIVQKISGALNAEGILAEVKMPATSSLDNLKYVIALDGVSDPGNMGTMLRTALALGWQGVFILPNSCDPFNDKALRAARGATFRLPFRLGSFEELDQLVKKNHLTSYAADLHGTSLEDIPSLEAILLVLGNEGHGISSELSSKCNPLTIPMPGDMESLNVAVAGGILMYGLLRKGKN